jgi:hypothetical protein
MKRLAQYFATIAVTMLISSSAFAAINYSEDFESYDPANPDALANADWLIFGSVFFDYPGCSAFEYGYGVFPAPTGGSGFSGIAEGGATGKALNAYSDYNNGDHGAGKCIETSLFQEIPSFDAADAGTYIFSFDTEVPPEAVPEDNVDLFGFVKLLDPGAGYVDIFGGAMVVDTETGGPKSIEVTLLPEHAGLILQWGFSTKSSNYEWTGRWYDNLSFATKVIPAPPPEVGVPIPFWAYLLMGGLIAGFGISRMRARQ